MVGCLSEGAELDDSVVCKSMLIERDRVILLDDVLYYDPARLVVPAVLHQKLIEEVHAGVFFADVKLSR